MGRLSSRLDVLAAKVAALSVEAGKTGRVVIVRMFCHPPDAVLVGYRDGTGRVLSADDVQQVATPAGTLLLLEEVWETPNV